MAVGPLIAGPFVLSSPGWLFLSVTGLFVMVTVGHARLPTEAAGETGPTVHGTGGLLTGIAGLPFAANALAFYLYFHFQHYLAVYAVERTSSQFYSLVLLLCFVLVIVVQPSASGLIRRMPYPLALAVGFAGLAAGLATLAIGTTWALLAGGALITLGDIVLFLKNDLEALRRSPAPTPWSSASNDWPCGLGACASGVLGGQLYGLGQGLGDTGWFWLLAAGQCLLLPPLLLLRRPGVRRRPPSDLSKGAMTTDDTNRRVPGR